MSERLTLVLVTTLLVASLPLSASAATVDAEQFADMCNTAPGGLIHVSGRLKVTGGSGKITQSCVVALGDAAKVIFRDVTRLYTSCVTPCTLNIGGSSGNDVVVKIINSTIEMDGDIQLTAGQNEDIVSAGGLLKVIDSVIIANSVELSAAVGFAFSSVGNAGGRVVVRNSRIVATETSFDVGVLIDSNAGGRSIVTDTMIEAVTAVMIASDNGTAKVKRNVFSSTPTVTVTANGGTCVTIDNTPSVAWS